VDLSQLFNEPDIVKRIKVNRIRWAGFVIGRHEETPLNKVFRSNFLDGAIGQRILGNKVLTETVLHLVLVYGRKRLVIELGLGSN
jgi:hypothetical protein